MAAHRAKAHRAPGHGYARTRRPGVRDIDQQLAANPDHWYDVEDPYWEPAPDTGDELAPILQPRMEEQAMLSASHKLNSRLARIQNRIDRLAARVKLGRLDRATFRRRKKRLLKRAARIYANERLRLRNRGDFSQTANNWFVMSDSLFFASGRARILNVLQLTVLGWALSALHFLISMFLRLRHRSFFGPQDTGLRIGFYAAWVVAQLCVLLYVMSKLNNISDSELLRATVDANTGTYMGLYLAAVFFEFAALASLSTMLLSVGALLLLTRVAAVAELRRLTRFAHICFSLFHPPHKLKREAGTWYLLKAQRYRRSASWSAGFWIVEIICLSAWALSMQAPILYQSARDQASSDVSQLLPRNTTFWDESNLTAADDPFGIWRGAPSQAPISNYAPGGSVPWDTLNPALDGGTGPKWLGQDLASLPSNNDPGSWPPSTLPAPAYWDRPPGANGTTWQPYSNPSREEAQDIRLAPWLIVGLPGGADDVGDLYRSGVPNRNGVMGPANGRDPWLPGWASGTTYLSNVAFRDSNTLCDPLPGDGWTEEDLPGAPVEVLGNLTTLARPAWWPATGLATPNRLIICALSSSRMPNGQLRVCPAWATSSDKSGGTPMVPLTPPWPGSQPPPPLPPGSTAYGNASRHTALNQGCRNVPHPTSRLLALEAWALERSGLDLPLVSGWALADWGVFLGWPANTVGRPLPGKQRNAGDQSMRGLGPGDPALKMLAGGAPGWLDSWSDWSSARRGWLAARALREQLVVNTLLTGQALGSRQDLLTELRDADNLARANASDPEGVQDEFRLLAYDEILAWAEMVPTMKRLSMLRNVLMALFFVMFTGITILMQLEEMTIWSPFSLLGGDCCLRREARRYGLQATVRLSHYLEVNALVGWSSLIGLLVVSILAQLATFMTARLTRPVWIHYFQWSFKLLPAPPVFLILFTPAYSFLFYFLLWRLAGRPLVLMTLVGRYRGRVRLNRRESRMTELGKKPTAFELPLRLFALRGLSVYSFFWSMVLFLLSLVMIVGLASPWPWSSPSYFLMIGSARPHVQAFSYWVLLSTNLSYVPFVISIFMEYPRLPKAHCTELEEDRVDPYVFRNMAGVYDQFFNRRGRAMLESSSSDGVLTDEEGRRVDYRTGEVVHEELGGDDQDSGNEAVVVDHREKLVVGAEDEMPEEDQLAQEDDPLVVIVDDQGRALRRTADGKLLPASKREQAQVDNAERERVKLTQRSRALEPFMVFLQSGDESAIQSIVSHKEARNANLLAATTLGRRGHASEDLLVYFMVCKLSMDAAGFRHDVNFWATGLEEGVLSHYWSYDASKQVDYGFQKSNV